MHYVSQRSLGQAGHRRSRKAENGTMAGGRDDPGNDSSCALRLALTGVAALGLVVGTLALGASVAYGVSSRVPISTADGAFVYGKVPVRPEITRRVVATRKQGATPLALLFRIARGELAPPTHVLPTHASTHASKHASKHPSTPTPNPTPTLTSTPSAAPFSGAVPALGKGWAWGCAAAIAYLNAYAAPGFTISCPGNADGHQASTTCVSGYSLCSDGRSIVIADPCPAAYMNEASNSRVLMGLWDAPVDPYGSCPD
jgi:hypothetical protein